MTPTSVPQDIIETIIDELRDDIRSLTTCALVSHAFRPQSQKHIFSRIALLVYYRNWRVQQINDILSIHPELALYVRHLRISLGRTPDHTLARTVRMLTQIRSLHFGWLDSSVGWDEYPVDVKSAILDLFYLPSLAKISISKIKLFPCISALGNSYQLRTLELFDVFPPVEDINDQSDPTALDNSQLVEKDMQLDSLRLKFSFYFRFSAETSAHTALLRILIKPHVFPGIARLRKLDVGWLTIPEEVKLCQKLLEVTTDSLQDLTLRLGRPYRGSQSLPPSLNLGSLSDLSTLSVAICATDTSLALLWLHQLLGSIPLVNKIEAFSLELTHGRVDLHDTS